MIPGGVGGDNEGVDVLGVFMDGLGQGWWVEEAA